MKKILTIIAAASIFAACSSDKELDTKTDVVLTDTSGMYKSNYSTDVSPEAVKEEAPVAQTRVIRETRVVYVDRPQARRQTVRQADPAEPVVASVPQQTNSGSQPQSTGTSTSDNSGSPNSGTGTTTAPAEPVKKEKEGWNNSTKGAVIGGVGGAVTGAILSKKKVKGAIIGGVIGAAGGYILGRKKDKAADEANTPQFTSY